MFTPESGQPQRSVCSQYNHRC